MNNIIQWYKQCDWINPSLALIAILGFILSIIFFIKSRRIKKPVWGTVSNNYINEKHTNKITVLYDGKDVNQLTETKVYFWNKGREQINKDDFETIDPFFIELCEPFEILDAIVLKQTNSAINTDLKIGENRRKLYVKYDFLSKNDGTLFQIYHTGKSGKDLKGNGVI
jgi:hypothetical protein